MSEEPDLEDIDDISLKKQYRQQLVYLYDQSVRLNLSTQLFNNISWLFNETNLIDSGLLEKFKLNRKVDGIAYYCLIAAYTLLILLGTCGNILVVCVVARKPAMRTARNMFIVNLAVSDLLLCLITSPLTLMEILTRYWPLGHNHFICKMIGTSQAISIFVSTLSITAIALDRYQVIVYPTRDSLQKVGAFIILGVIWFASVLLASPMYLWRTLKIHTNINLSQFGIESIAYCLEDWPVEHGRAYYSLFVLIIQYVLPIITVVVAYSRICKKLQYRYVSSSVSVNNKRNQSLTTRRKSRDDRRRKTNTLLVAIAIMFCVSWLPLNIYNLLVDYYNPFGEDYHTMMVVYAVCHMMGMSSACSNPLLYGWLNDNFRKEFKEILALACPCIKVDVVRDRFDSVRSSLSRKRNKSKCNLINNEVELKKKVNIGGDEKTVFIEDTKTEEEEEEVHGKEKRISGAAETMMTCVDEGMEYNEEC